MRAKSANEEDVLNNQAGIGSVFGIGLHYEFKNGINIFSGLHNKIHGIILFDNIGYKKQLVDVGLQTGIRYQF